MNLFDTTEEYERLFGKARQVQLLDFDNDEYLAFKETIMQQPTTLSRRLQLKLKLGNLFDDIHIISNEKKEAIRRLFQELYDIKSPQRFPKKNVGGLIITISGEKSPPKKKGRTKTNKEILSTEKSEKPLFKITVDGKCDATGYYNEKDDHFYIQQGSLVSSTFESLLGESPIQPAWKKFVDNDCTHWGSYCIVERDVRLPKASLAATFVLGRTANNAYWRDTNGLFLKDYYPERFAYTYM